MVIIPISEIFESIQGEGKYVGTPSVFVRFWGCNLRCRFKDKNCDTPYAVNNRLKNCQQLSYKEVVSTILSCNAKHIVFTGGEPLLYQETIFDIINGLPSCYTFEVETNGTIPLDPLFYEFNNYNYDKIWYNISVKLMSSNQESGPYDKRRVNYDAIKSFPREHSCFKFVLTSPDDIKEINLIKGNVDLTIYLMPEGVTRNDILKNSQMVINYCLLYGYRFSPREHIVLWNKKRKK